MKQCENGKVSIRCFIDGCSTGRYDIQITDINDLCIINGTTDLCGRFLFSVDQTGIYRIRAACKGECNPRAQNRWVFLCPQSTCSITFAFNRIYRIKYRCSIRGVLKDANYPEYKLSEGVFSLWLKY